MLVPKLRFPDYSGDWKKSTIGESGEFYYGRSCPKWSVTNDATIPCIRYGELYTKFENKIDKVYSYTSIEPANLRFSKGTEVLVPRVGEDPMDYTHCAWLSLPNVAIGEMISVYNTDNNPLFTALMFNAKLRTEFAKRVEGGSVTNLYYEKLRNIVIYYPTDLEEQQKIADFLSTIDEVIAQSEAEVQNLKQQKKAAMQKIFSQEVRFKREDGSEYPEWEETTFGETCSGFEYGMNTAACDYDGVNKYIRITDIDDTSRRYMSENAVSPKGNMLDKYIVKPNDILFARTGASVGKAYLYKEFDGLLYYAGFLIRANVNTEHNAYFVFAQTLTYDYWNWVKLTSMRTGQQGINAQEYKEYQFFAPCLEEQQKIADFLSAYDEAISYAKQELDKWKELKKGLLQQMFV